MTVLDIGCGAGGLSFMVAEIVQERGSVIGVDMNREVVARAGELARERKISNVQFIEAELSALSLPADRFDAVVGRRILMYLPDVPAVLRRLSKFVKPGGLLVFQETDATLGARGTVHMPLHDRAVNWIWQTLDREGADSHMGFNLPMKMREAGMEVGHVRAEPVILGQDNHDSLAAIIRALLPRITGYGVASEEEIDIETLPQRLSAECPDGAIYVSDVAFGVWGVKPV